MVNSNAVPVGCGIDFGTSNSAIAVAYADRVDVVPLGPSPSATTLPSFVYLHRGGKRAAGDEAVRTFLKSGHEKTDCWKCPLAPYGWDTDCRQYRKGGGCNDARLLSGVKHELAKLGFAGTNSWATDFTVGSLVAVVMKRLKDEADKSVGQAVPRVVVGHPVVFAGADPSDRVASDAEAFSRLEQAALEAGFEEVAFLSEPTAAVIGEHTHHGVEVAVDFGGGTFDVAVMDSRGEQPRIAGTSGVAVGGEMLDGVLFETSVGPALGLDVVPNWLFNELRTASSVRLLMADPGIPAILARIGGGAAGLIHALLYEGHAYDFYRAIEAARFGPEGHRGGARDSRHRSPPGGAGSHDWRVGLHPSVPGRPPEDIRQGAHRAARRFHGRSSRIGRSGPAALGITVSSSVDVGTLTTQALRLDKLHSPSP